MAEATGSATHAALAAAQLTAERLRPWEEKACVLQRELDDTAADLRRWAQQASQGQAVLGELQAAKAALVDELASCTAELRAARQLVAELQAACQHTQQLQVRICTARDTPGELL